MFVLLEVVVDLAVIVDGHLSGFRSKSGRYSSVQLLFC